MKDIKYKETNILYQKNLKATTKLLDQVQGLYEKMNIQVISISNLNGDLIARIWEVDMLKKENKMLHSKAASLERKFLVVDEQKMLHAIQQMKQIVMETEALNCQKF
jgi:hypothetical protein